MRKWLLIAVVLAVVALGFFAPRYRATVDARVAEEIRSQPDSARARRAMVVTLADGREYPVNYLLEGNLVFMGIDGLWWRDFQGAGAPVAMDIRGQHLTGHAKVVLDDPDYTAEVFKRLRPNAPAWLPTWLNGKLVVITLTKQQTDQP